MAEYQTDFSSQSKTSFDVEGRIRKAKTTLAVIKEASNKPLDQCTVLNVGASTAIIDKYLAPYVKNIICIDIDEKAIRYAAKQSVPENLSLLVGNAESLPAPENSVDIVLCSHIYEHVPHPERMMDEIHRVLAKDGICYFAAANRIMWTEPHHKLKGLSLLPKPLAHIYMRLAGKGNYYYESHYTYWGLKKLCSKFKILDYSHKIVSQPQKYNAEYMLPHKSNKQLIARLITTFATCFLPSYIWILNIKRED